MTATAGRNFGGNASVNGSTTKELRVPALNTSVRCERASSKN